jgi:hypothetical protein
MFSFDEPSAAPMQGRLSDRVTKVGAWKMPLPDSILFGWLLVGPFHSLCSANGALAARKDANSQRSMFVSVSAR